MIEIVTATHSDFEAIDAIAQKNLGADYYNVHSTEEIDYMQDLHYAHGSTLVSEDDVQCTFVAKEDGVCLGFVCVTQEGPELYHLTKIYVTAPRQNNGLGSALFDRVVSYIKERHHNEQVILELNVSSHNKSANFYHRVGMHKVRENIVSLDNNFTFVQDVYSMTIDCP